MQYSVVVLGATGNVGGRIVQLLIKDPLCKKLVVVTRRKTSVFHRPQGLRGGCQHGPVRRGGCAGHPRELTSPSPRSASARAARRCPSRKEVVKIEIAYPEAFCHAAKAGGALVCTGS